MKGIDAAARGLAAYFEVEELPLVGLELPGVPGTAPEVAPWPVGVAVPDALSEDEPEDMPDELLGLLGLVDEDEELPDVP